MDRQVYLQGPLLIGAFPRAEISIGRLNFEMQSVCGLHAVADTVIIFLIFVLHAWVSGTLVASDPLPP